MTVQEWLGTDNKLGIDIWERKYRFNGESFDDFLHRLSNGNPILERLIKERKFLFGGRTTSNRNTGKKASMMNCYSRGFIQDSLDDILQANYDIGMTFKTQGGQGLSLSKLRPRGCGVSNGMYESDGIIPFMEMYNRTTESVSQGGSRKGALLIGLDIWHKEAEDFIKIKSEEGRSQKANLSLEIDDEFMDCVKKYYDTGEIITKHIVRDYDGNKIDFSRLALDSIIMGSLNVMAGFMSASSGAASQLGKIETNANSQFALRLVSGMIAGGTELTYDLISWIYGKIIQ